MWNEIECNIIKWNGMQWDEMEWNGIEKETQYSTIVLPVHTSPL